MVQRSGSSGPTTTRGASREPEDTKVTSNTEPDVTTSTSPQLATSDQTHVPSETSVAYQYAAVQQMLNNRDHIEYQLTVREQPKHSRMCGIGEKADRRPIDPAPIVQLRIITHDQPVRNGLSIDSAPSSPPTERKHGQGLAKPSTIGVRGGIPVSTSLGDGWEDKAWYLENPYFFMYAMLCHAETDDELHLLSDGRTRYTSGSCVSCLYHLKDIDGSHQGFFVFPDLSIRVEGRYRLKLCLFEIIGQSVHHCKSVYSDPFHVYTAKRFPGMEESTRLSRSFAEQGLKVRVRKHPRSRRRESKRQRNDSDASDTDQLAPRNFSALSVKRSRGSDASISGLAPPGRHPAALLPKGEQIGYGDPSRPLLSPGQSHLPPPRRIVSSPWEEEASRLRGAIIPAAVYDQGPYERSGRDARDLGYGPAAPDQLYRDAYTMRERDMMYPRPVRRTDTLTTSGPIREAKTREDLTRMPPPLQYTRYAEHPPPPEYSLSYQPANRRASVEGTSSSSQKYARPLPPLDYMTYEERRAFEEHHAYPRSEVNPVLPYGARGPSTGYARTSSSDSTAAYTSADVASRLGRPSFPMVEQSRSQRAPEILPPMERKYGPRSSPPRSEVLYPPPGRGPAGPAYESDGYVTAPLASSRRDSDPYLRVPGAVTEPFAGRHGHTWSGRTVQPRAELGRAVPVPSPNSTTPHAIRHESLTGLPMNAPRDAMDPAARRYSSSFVYPAHTDTADASNVLPYGSREEVDYRRGVYRPQPDSRPPGPPRRPN